MKNQQMEIYVHIPFCVRKCDYCDFLSGPWTREVQSAYVEAVLREIDATDVTKEVSSVFFGGGTPSLLPAGQLIRILERLAEHFTISEHAEISLEANPGTVTKESLSAYRTAGFNRISFGCQSLCAEELKRLGRIHTAEDFLESYQMAREAGFSNINVDLMSALPGQTFQSWEKTLRQAAALGPEHISAYSLILEEGTKFYDNRETLDLPDEDTERMMYEKTAEILLEYGYRQYEISNYAKNGYACRHNVGYWKRVPYLGIGLGSASLIGECRYRNTTDMQTYLRMSHDPSLIRRDIEHLSEREQMEEYMILGLRMTEGISLKEFYEQFGVTAEEVYGEVFEKYKKLALLEETEGRIRLTGNGVSLSNVVLADFLQDK